MINVNSTTYSSSGTVNTSNQQAQATTSSSVDGNSSSDKTSKAESAVQVNISNQAVQLAELRQEFFSGGAMQNSDIPKLAARLVEIGVMDASHLAEFNANSSASSDTETQTLSQFALDRAASIADDDDNIDLYTMLSFIATTFADVEQASGQANFSGQLSQSINTLDGLLLEPDFKDLNKATQASYSNLKLGLSLIQQLPESRIDQGKLNDYLRIANS